MSTTPNKANQVDTAPPSEVAQDFYALRSLGLNLISQLGTDIWTDFNAHDPGITMLETIAYAITDLGYRTEFPISDLIAQAGLSTEEQQQNLQETSFHTAANILPSAPVTLLDFRKIFSDLKGVSNAWVEPVNHFEPYKGLRKVVIQPTVPEMEVKALEALEENVEQTFWANRNLGEALDSIVVLQPKKLALELQLVVADNEKPEKAVAAAIVKLSEFLEAKVRFLTLTKMLEFNDGEVAKAFEGPTLKHGFLPDSSLSPKFSEVDPDQLIRTIRHLPGIASIIGLKILTKTTPEWSGSPVAWVGGDGKLPLSENEFPVLDDLEYFQFVITQRQRPYELNMHDLADEIALLESMQYSSKRAPDAQDLPIPIGKFRNLEQYFSIQYDFPSIYNLRPGTMAYLQGDQRQGETNQLRGFLLLFDQIIANYLAQLGNISELFSWSSDVTRTYFFQGLERSLQNLLQLLVGLPDDDTPSPHLSEAEKAKFNASLLEGLARYKSHMGALQESKSEFLSRRTKFLDHLLARVGTDLKNYIAQLPSGDPETFPKQYISAAEEILSNFPALSSRRGTGGDPLLNADIQFSKPGIQNWVESLFAIPTPDRESDDWYHRLTITGSDPIASQAVFGQLLLSTDDGSPIDMQKVAKLGCQPENFKIVQADNDTGHFTIKLFDNVETGAPGGLYNFVNTYLTVQDAISVIELAVETFLQFNLASERFYVVDHLLLRPFPTNAVHGLEVFDESEELLLQTIGWYPLPTISKMGEMTASNTEIVTVDTLDKTKFIFQVFAHQGLKPYPVYGPQLPQLPSQFDADSKTALATATGEKMRNYILRYYPKLIDKASDLGKALSTDFLDIPLPSDWVSNGKADLMQKWGSEGLLDVLTRWQTYLGIISVGDTILQILANIEQNVQNIPTTGDQMLLVQFANRFYVDTFQTGTELQTALQKDLGSGQPEAASDPLAARIYLAAVGKDLGNTYIEFYFGPFPIFPTDFGRAITINLALTKPSGMPKSLRLSLSQGFIDANKTLTQDLQGKAFIEKLLSAQSPSDISGASEFLEAMAEAGRRMYKKWVASYWPDASTKSDKTALGNAVFAWLASIPGFAPPTTDAIVKLINQSITTWLQSKTAQFQDNATDFGDYIANALFSDSTVLFAETTALQKVAFDAMQLYGTTDLAIADVNSTDKIALNLVKKLSLQLASSDQTLWALGSNALAFYINNFYAGQIPDAETLGAGLIKDFATNVLPPQGSGAVPASIYDVTPPATVAAPDQLTIIACYTLSDYLEKVVVPETPKGGTTADALLLPKSQKATYDKEQANFETEVTDASAAVDQLLTGTGPTSPDLYTWFGEGNLANFLYNAVDWKAKPVYLDSLDKMLALLQKPVSASELTAVQPHLENAGYVFLLNFFRSRWDWQFTNATALGNAVLNLWPTTPVQTPVPPLPVPVIPSRKEVLYTTTLTFYGPDDIPTELVSEQKFQSYQDTKAAIETLITRVGEAMDGSIQFSKVMKTVLQPEGLPLAMTPHEHVLANPYSNIFTVIAPNWPVRFQEKGFQERMEQVVRASAPAHLLTIVLWLSKQEMQVFEESYSSWIAEDIDDIARDLYGRRLTRLILHKALNPMPLLKVIDGDEPEPTA